MFDWGYLNDEIFKDSIRMEAVYTLHLKDAFISAKGWKLLPTNSLKDTSNSTEAMKLVPTDDFKAVYREAEKEHADAEKLAHRRVPIRKEDIDVGEAKILFQAIHNEPFLEKECYSVAWLVPDMPEDKPNEKRLILSSSIFNDNRKLMMPHDFKSFCVKDSQKYWKQFLNICNPENAIKIDKVEKLDFWALSVFNRIRMQGYSVEHDKVVLKIIRKITVAPYCRGDLCVCLPLPDENPDASGLEMVVQGKRLRENIQSISENLDLRLKQLFISAPSGSGKEGYSTYVHYGSGRKGEPNKVDMTSPRKEVEKMLRGSVVEKGVFVEGLFAKASGGTIVFDEIDKLEAKSEVFDRDLSYLLRPLDPGTYLPENGSQEMKVDEVTMIFMGKKSPKELREGPTEANRERITPPDFFTRVSDPKVHLKHPLPDKLNDEYKTTFSCFVRFFYWKAVEEMALGETGLDKQSKRKLINRTNELLQKCSLGKFDDSEPTTAERRFIAYLKKWLGDFIGPIGSIGRFYLIKSLWFEIEPSFGPELYSKPSVREISKVVRSFVRKNWHLAESENRELRFPNLINGNSDSRTDSNDRKKGPKIADALAATLSKELKLKVSQKPKNC